MVQPIALSRMVCMAPRSILINQMKRIFWNAMQKKTMRMKINGRNSENIEKSNYVTVWEGKKTHLKIGIINIHARIEWSIWYQWHVKASKLICHSKFKMEFHVGIFAWKAQRKIDSYIFFSLNPDCDVIRGKCMSRWFRLSSEYIEMCWLL